MAKPDDKLVFVVDGNVKSAEQAMRGLDQAIKRVGSSADITETALADLQQAATESAVKAEAAARRQVEAQAKATAAVEEHKQAQAKVADAVEAAAQDRIAAEKKVQAVVDASMQDQLAEVQALARAQERLNEVRTGTKGDRSKGATEARRVANEEVRAARAALAAKQEAAVAGIAAVRKEAKERAAAGAASVKAAKDEASLKLAASKEAGRAARATAREALVATAEVERRINAAQKLVDKLERQASPEGQRDQAFKSFRVQRDAAIRERIADMEKLRDAALADASLEANERAQIEAASSAAISRERAKLNAAEIRAMNTLGLRRKQQIQEEIADVRKAGQDAASVHAKGSGERLRIERETAAKIKALNNELATATASAFTQRMQSAAQGLQGLGESLTNAGQAVAPASLAAGAALGFSARDAGNFQAQVQSIRALYRLDSEAQLDAMEALLRDMGANNKSFDAQEVGKAAEILASQGLGLQEQLDGALEAVVSAAAGGGASIDSAALLITQAGNLFKYEAKDLQKVADIATGLLDASRFGVEDLSLALSQGGLGARSAGLSLEDFAVLTGVLGDNGFQSGSDAGTSIKSFFQAFTKDDAAAVEAQKALGFDLFDENGQFKDLAYVAEGLAKAQERLTPEVFAKAVTDRFGSDSGRVAQVLAGVGAGGVEDYRGKVQQGDAEASRAIREQGLNAELNALGNAVKELNIALGESGFLGLITSAVQGLTSFVKWVADLHPAVQGIIVGFLALVAIGGPLLIFFGKLAFAISQIIAVWPQIMAGVTAVRAFFAAWAVGGTVLSVIWGALQTLAAFLLGLPALPLILFAGAALMIWWFWDEIVAGATWAIDTLVGMWTGFWDWLWGKSSDQASAVAANGPEPAGEWVSSSRGKVGDAPAYADGGRVRGPGTSRSDSIWARLSDGENVTNARASRFWGQGFMDSINKMDPSAVMAPVPVPVRDQAPLAGLHPVTIKLDREFFDGFYGTEPAVDQIRGYLARQSNTRYAKPSRSEQ